MESICLIVYVSDTPSSTRSYKIFFVAPHPRGHSCHSVGSSSTLVSVFLPPTPSRGVVKMGLTLTFGDLANAIRVRISLTSRSSHPVPTTEVEVG